MRGLCRFRDLDQCRAAWFCAEDTPFLKLTEAKNLWRCFDRWLINGFYVTVERAFPSTHTI